MSYQGTTRKSIGIAFATQYAELGIQFMAVMVLARVLSPDQIGTFSIASFLMTMLHVFRDFGVVQYIIAERDLTTDKLRSAMGVAILLALAVAAVLYGLSGPIAAFYQNPEIRKVLVVMSASFAISPFGSLLLGLLRRDNRLGDIFIIKIVSAMSHVTVAVSLALAGFGAVSLAWANFAGILAFGVTGNLLRSKDTPWMPSFRNVRAILSFGSVSSLGNLATIAGTSAPDLILGKVANMAAVGYFSRATGLVQLFTRLISGALTPLVLPYFSQMRRDGREVAPAYLQTVELLTALAWPFFAALLLLAYPMTRALYGAQWDASVPVLRLLCVASAINAVSLFASQAMIACGQVRSSTASNLLAQPVRVLAVLAAAAYGLHGVALALIASECVALVVTSWFLKKTIGVGMRNLMKACTKSAAMTVCAAIGPALVWLVWQDRPSHSWGPLLIGIAGAAVGWLASMKATGHPLGGHILPLLRVAAVKQAVKDVAYRVGLFSLYHRLRNRDTLTVSMFHRVLPATDPRYAGADPEWTMTPQSLAECLVFFRRHYHVVSAAEVFAAMRGERRLPPRAMLVTFDDGWADTAEYAQPVLEQHGVQALIFVAGGAIDRAEPFWEERVFSFLATHKDALPALATAMARQNLAPLENMPVRVDEGAIRAVIRQLGQRERAAVLALAASLPDDAGAAPAMLTAAQLAGLVAGGHAIGGHGMTHQPLTRVADLKAEVAAAQGAVTAYLQHPIESMSLPHGASSPAVLAQCREEGYRYLFNSESHLNVLAGGHANAAFGPIGRIHISEREIKAGGAAVDPTRLANWLFLRHSAPIEVQGGAGRA